MIQRLERRLGRYAIPHLMNYIIGGYVIGYLIYVASMMTGQPYILYLTLDPRLILQGQVWRLVTWVLFPPIQNVFFEIIMMVFYWQLGTVLENTWGTFRFNLYIFGGMIFTIIGAFLVFAYEYIVTGIPVSLSGYFSTEYINLSIFLAFAVSYPEMRVLLYFIIPVKMKWMALVYGLIAAYEFVMSGTAGKVAIVASLLNFIVFYLMTRNYKSISPYEQARKRKWRQATGSRGRSAGQPGGSPFGGFSGRQTGGSPFGKHSDGQGQGGSPFGGFAGSGGTVNIARHKCAVCGRTDVSNPELTFRFCSKCNGNYEYCNDHLFTHKHVE